MPDSFATTSDGILLVANGINETLRWDGFTPQMEKAGVPAPTTAPTMASSGPVGGGTVSITGTFFAYIRFVDNYGNYSDLSPISASLILTTAASGITYSGLEIPSDPKITRRQILRNTDGQTRTFYVDIDTTDLTSTSLHSVLTDDILRVQEAFALFDDNNISQAFTRTVPPAHKAVLTAHQSRAFYAVDGIYALGNVAVTYGSTTVTGIGTAWFATFVNRFLSVAGADKKYLIDSVNETAQTLTLDAPYLGTTDPYALYSIRPAPAERRLVYYSVAGLPEAVPPINAFSIQEDGDDMTGQMSKGSFVYTLELRHIYRFTYQNDPATDGFNFLSCNRGCINNRCWVNVEGTSYMLDEQGIHGFTGGEESEPLSTMIQDLFESGIGTFKINWSASKHFFAVHFPPQETIRWFLALSGSYLPRHALAYHYRAKRWWFEEYPVPVGAAVLGTMNAVPTVFLAGKYRKIYAFNRGTLDGPDSSAGTVRGTVSSSAPCSFADASAIFAGSGLVGAPVSIVAGRGKGQQRIVAAVSGTTVTITQPWLVRPDATSTYQLGGIQWSYKTGWFRYVEDDRNSPRRVEIVFQPLPTPATFDLRLYHDHSEEPDVWSTAYTSDQAAGVASEAGSTDLVCDLTKRLGFVQKRIDGHREIYADGKRFMAIGLSGVTGQDAQVIFQATIDGVQ